MLVALLTLVLLGLFAMVVILRRRARQAAEVARVAAAMPKPLVPQPPTLPRPRRMVVRGGAGGAGLAIATSSAMVCPTCRTEYHGMTYCTRDARRLVPPEEMMATRGSNKSAGLMCMACRRAYEPGLRACPHDGNELLPFSVYNATRPRRRAGTSDPAGVVARICPVCATKYDLNARFCGHDAGELVVIN
ncbi:MAG: hypothetical protein NT062_11765 [Proteobacteria bacterium]|nr:hypothetical protein [Pseudomonadota bacterium]